MNERLEIGGDLQDEYTAIQDAERAEAYEDDPIIELCEADLEDWYESWLAEQNNPQDIAPLWEN